MATTARHGGDSTLKYLRERNEETVAVREIQDLNLRSAWSGMKELWEVACMVGVSSKHICVINK